MVLSVSGNCPDFLVAHRGDHEFVPENTLVAFERAVSAGARWLECDIQFTCDHVPVLLHDTHLGRLCGVDRDISSFDMDALSGLSISAPAGPGVAPVAQPIPLLTDFLHWLDSHADTALFLEIKSDTLDRLSSGAIVRMLLPLIEESRALIIPISSAATIVEEVHAHALPVGWVVADDAPTVMPDYVFIDGCNDAAIRHWRERGARVAVYTVNDVAMLKSCRAAGADLVETDHFTTLAKALHAG